MTQCLNKSKISHEIENIDNSLVKGRGKLLNCIYLLKAYNYINMHVSYCLAGFSDDFMDLYWGLKIKEDVTMLHC